LQLHRFRLDHPLLLQDPFKPSRLRFDAFLSPNLGVSIVNKLGSSLAAIANLVRAFANR
jgi:hypothetical protein